MNRPAILVLLGVLSVGTAAAQSEKDLHASAPPTTSSSANEPATNALGPGTPIDATLSKSIDSKKAKPGDSVIAEAAEATKEGNGTILIPRGAKLQGHVTQASSRSKGDAYSSVGIVFDKAVLKDGKEIPINVNVQAIASPPPSAMAAPSAGVGMGPSPSGGAGAPGSVPGRTMGSQSQQPGAAAPMPNESETVANTDVGNASSGKGAVGGLDGSGRLTPNSRGVFGMQGIGLAETTTSDQQTAAVITSTGKNVHLDSGTQLLLVTRTTTQTPKS
jgi:hypothetical protein